MQVVLKNDSAAAAYIENLFYLRWIKPASPELYREITAHECALRERFADRRVARLEIIEKEAIIRPSRELQAAIDERDKLANEMLSAQALVITASGFASSLVRAAITAVLLVRTPSYPYKILSDVAAGCDWIAPHVRMPDGPAPSGAELMRRLP